MGNSNDAWIFGYVASHKAKSTHKLKVKATYLSKPAQALLPLLLVLCLNAFMFIANWFHQVYNMMDLSFSLITKLGKGPI